MSQADISQTRALYISTLNEADRAKFEKLSPKQQEKILIDFKAATAPATGTKGTVSGQLAGSGNAANDENSGLTLTRESTPSAAPQAESTPTQPPSLPTPEQTPTKRQQFVMKQYEGGIKAKRFKTAADYQLAIDKFNSGQMGDPEDFRLVIQRMDEEIEKFSPEEIADARSPEKRAQRLKDDAARHSAMNLLYDMNQRTGDRLQKQMDEQGAAEMTWDWLKSVTGNGETMGELVDTWRENSEKLHSMGASINKADNTEFDRSVDELNMGVTGKELREIGQAQIEYQEYLGYKSAAQAYENIRFRQFSQKNLVSTEKELGGADAIRSAVSNYDSLSPEEKFDCLKQMSYKAEIEIRTKMNNLGDGTRGYYYYEHEHEEKLRNLAKATGNADLEKRIDEYIQSQQEGAGYVKAGATLLATTAVIATGGLGLVGASIATAGVSAAVEIGDRATNGRKGDLSGTELLKIGKNAAIDGAMVFVGGKLVSKVATTGLSKMGKIATVSLGEGAMSAAGDYGKTGEVTVAGVATGMLFGGIGGAIELRGLSKAYAPDIADAAADALGDATSTTRSIDSTALPPGAKIVDGISDNIAGYSHNRIYTKNGQAGRDELIETTATELRKFLEKNRGKYISEYEIEQFYQELFPNLDIRVTSKVDSLGANLMGDNSVAANANIKQRPDYKGIDHVDLGVNLHSLFGRFNSDNAGKLYIDGHAVDILCHEGSHGLQAFTKNDQGQYFSRLIAHKGEHNLYRQVTDGADVYRKHIYGDRRFNPKKFIRDINKDLNRHYYMTDELRALHLKNFIREAQAEKQAYEIGIREALLFNNPSYARSQAFRDDAQARAVRATASEYHFGEKIELLKEEYFNVMQRIREANRAKRANGSS